MRKLFLLLVVVAQVAWVAWMALDREILLASDTVVHVRTAPVDPRDLFRGDYVVLRYGLNAASPSQLDDAVRDQRDREGQRVYAHLRPVSGSTDLYELARVGAEPPVTGPFLAGETHRGWRFPWPQGGVAVRYGIEKLFVEQGRGLELEEKLGQRDGLQVPMEVELAVDEGGRAAIRGYRWSPVGTHLETLRRPGLRPPEAAENVDPRAPENTPEPPAAVDQAVIPADPEARATGRGAGPEGDPAAPPARAPEMRFTLHNVGDRPLWIVDPGEHCSFQLTGPDLGAAPLPLAGDPCAQIEPSPEDFHRLEPGGTYAARIDLDTERWWLDLGDGPKTVTEAGADGSGPNRLRLVYRPDPAWAARAPSALAVAPRTAAPEPLASQEEIWSIALPSPAFATGGRID